AQLRVGAVEAQGPLLGRPQLRASEPRLAGEIEGPQERSADEAHEEKVVEVSGLEGRVLPVVGEAEELASVRREPRLLPVHPPQGAGDQDRRRGASTFGRERGETGSVTGRGAMRRSAAEAEAEATGDEPGL